MQPSGGFETIPKPFRRIGPGVIELRQGGGCLAVFGLPFFLLGVYLLLGALGFVVVNDEFSHPNSRSALAGMSLTFGVPGAAFIWGRRSVTLDRLRGLVTRRFSILAPLWTVERQLAEFNAIVIVLQADAESVDRYPVQLRASAGRNFTISSPAIFGEARTQAAFVAQELQFPIVDTTTEHEVVLTPDHAVDTLQDRLKAAGAGDRPPTPTAMRSQVSESPVGVTISIPRRTSPLAGGIAAVFGLAVLLIVAPTLWRVWQRADTPLGVRMALVGFLIFFFGLLPLASSAAAFGFIRNRVVAQASPAGMTIERHRSAGGVKAETLPASDILDIDYSTMRGMVDSARRAAGYSAGATRFAEHLGRLVPNKGIVIKTRRGLITFGEDLRSDELTWLVWILKNSLGGLNR
jgi:hypothetical protein